MREAGTSTLGWRTCRALRMAVSMSAIGSVGAPIVLPLPARFHHAGNLAPERPLPEADAAKLELAQIAPRPPAEPAAVAMADLELGLPPQRFVFLRCGRQDFLLRLSLAVAG